MNNNYYVYILTNKYRTVFYTGVTNDLYRRIVEHKIKLNESFTSDYINSQHLSGSQFSADKEAWCLDIVENSKLDQLKRIH